MTAPNDAPRIVILVNNEASEGLLPEHGLALWIEVDGRRILFDTGQGPALGRNAENLGIDLRTADAVVLSHGHYDHTGGLPGVLESAPVVRVYAHSAVTGIRYSIRAAKPKSIGMPGAARLAVGGLPSDRLRWLIGPEQLAPNIGIASHIPRETSYEDTGGPFFTDEAGQSRDPIDDDLALWIRTGRGLVVVAGCSHAGLINTLRHCMRTAGESRLHAVLGGFHLNEATEARLARTMDALTELAPDVVVPCHCTGSGALQRLKRRLGDRVMMGAAGRAYLFGTEPATWTRSLRIIG